MKIGFIGCGNMGSALARAVLMTLPADHLLIYDKNEEKGRAFAEENGAVFADASAVVSEVDYLFLGVKPQMLGDTLDSLRQDLAARKDSLVLISMAAGMTISSVKELSGGLPVIRIMPNLPVSVGEGLIMYVADATVGKSRLTAFLDLMKHAGLLLPLPERLIDAGTAVSGCGPAFVCLFAEALADGGVQCGLPREVATQMAEQTLVGTAKLLLESGKHPAALKDAVCSPGGSTIEGVHVLEESAFRGSVAEAVLSSYRRNVELGK